MAQQEVKSVNVYIEPKMKADFRKKLLDDNIDNMQVFFEYFIKQYVEDKLTPKVIEEIKSYQKKNPGKIEETYIKVLISEKEHKTLSYKKIDTGIKPPYICRYFIEKYLDNEIPLSTLKAIKSQ